jgi:hypothetical protein
MQQQGIVTMVLCAIIAQSVVVGPIGM